MRVPSFIRSILGQKSASPPSIVLRNSPERDSLQNPIPFLNYDEHGLYLTATHATSSAYIEAIRREGLKPIHNLRLSITEYLQSLAPDRTQQIERILRFEEENDRYNGFSLLVSGRLNCKPDRRCIYANLLLGGRNYLQSASSNALEDGGEVFKAARKLLEQHTQMTFQPRFPEAHCVVILIKLRLHISQEGFTLSDVPDYERDFHNPVDISYLGGAAEIRIVGEISPRVIRIFSLEDFLKREVAPTTERARIELQRIVSRSL